MNASPLRIVAWAFYAVGILLVAGSYLRLVSPKVGWIGWGIGMIGWGLSHLFKWKPGDVRLRHLAELRGQGVISAEEYERQVALERERLG